ncbi:tol-pal system YbgF family protein [Hymenobacter endophyticus]|uniref:Tetratricopeptide repeat protein n=1 Tax=Hymenobacter endophyticus TaxID=3076335 RepID=A0ABU3TCY1_9BACT|nr:tetratricopeptide repeat protein [Hymenobacter endophyticus]MDU0369229.1 tetratricopeptide repeat protein [Hymenobacter endophyticus]
MVKTPTVRNISWIAYVVFYGLIVLLAWLGTGISSLDFIQCLLPAMLAAYLLSWTLRTTLGRYQQRGMQLIRKDDFLNAIPHFEQSYAYFSEKKWLDKWRYILMLSTSQMEYREMALNNIAFCYSQLGQGESARRYYHQVLAEYPDNGLAQAALKMLDAGPG